MSLRNMTLVLIVVLSGSLSLVGQEAKPLDLTSLKGGEEVSFEIADGVKMVFCWIPKGTCQLGSPKAEQDYLTNTFFEGKRRDWLDNETEASRGQFKTEGFWLGKTECTQKEWQSVMGANPSYFCATGQGKAKVQGFDTANFPVEQLSWDDTQIFLKKLNAKGGMAKSFGKAGRFQLPHEDAWEYAYRGGKGNKQHFYWGDALNGDKANNDGSLSPLYSTETKGAYLERTTTVGSYAKVATHPWGLSDMSGNAYEWCDNLYSIGQKNRIVRGGSWYSDPAHCRAARRLNYPPEDRNIDCGVRVCMILN